MTKAVTTNAGQHDMLCVRSMTFVLRGFPITHRLAHLPNPSLQLKWPRIPSVHSSSLGF